ncbi:ATP synthase subunit I [Geobacter pickeringii]|uniref:ATP synthase subunit I n=1 Tax=Geobacter pickeringii TaxID=345632 RepID=A0A0B5BH87_9BACT|nr:ATP synthase subunit I [Geobacter pickeringii]AJE04549.1 hypothetical protein GPICK_15320 [Geobacter pickeringii]
MAAKIDENNVFAAVTKGSWALLGLLTVTGYVLQSPRFAAGVAAGGTLALANYYWLMSILRRILHQQPTQPVRYAQVRYLLRLTLIAIALYLLIVRAHIDIMGLFVGLSIIAAVIVVLSFYMYATKGE